MKKRSADKYFACLSEGKMYAFEASSCIMSVEEILSSIVPFNKCQLSCWSEAYKKGYDDAYSEILDIAKKRKESKGATK